MYTFKPSSEPISNRFRLTNPNITALTVTICSISYKDKDEIPRPFKSRSAIILLIFPIAVLRLSVVVCKKIGIVVNVINDESDGNNNSNNNNNDSNKDINRNINYDNDDNNSKTIKMMTLFRRVIVITKI